MTGPTLHRQRPRPPKVMPCLEMAHDSGYGDLDKPQVGVQPGGLGLELGAEGLGLEV